jgi:pyruvate dehydrogenase E1 component beta subunit
VGAALGGLRPVVEIMFVDFLAVALSQLANEAAMIGPLSGRRWPVPLVIRAACGGGYGDAGQHEQTLWGQIASIPGVAVAVPSCAVDAAGLMLSLVNRDGPSVLLEHKLMSASWLDQLAGPHRPGIDLSVPEEEVPDLRVGSIAPVPLGVARTVREGADVVIFSVAVGVHRSLQAATDLVDAGIRAAVIDLRTVSPLDEDAIESAAARARAVVVVDEDHPGFGLAAEVAALLAERGVHRPFARVTNTGILPYAPHLERRALPSPDRIAAAVKTLLHA